MGDLAPEERATQQQTDFRRSLRQATIRYGKCAHPDCSRVVPLGILYCCSPCSSAAGAPEAYRRLAEHSVGCEERQADGRTATGS